MSLARLRSWIVLAVAGTITAGLVATAAPADAAPATPAKPTASSPLRGLTTVTTAPGIAATLLRAGVLPLPVIPGTTFGVSLPQGQLAVSYGFPIVSGNPDLAGPSGDILHRGGIQFIGRGAALEIGRFDIDLAAGKVFATEINRKPGRIAVLDLDLSKLSVRSGADQTVLTGITVRLDPAAAGALNSTFRIALPTDGSLVFGSAKVEIRA